MYNYTYMYIHIHIYIYMIYVCNTRTLLVTHSVLLDLLCDPWLGNSVGCTPRWGVNTYVCINIYIYIYMYIHRERERERERERDRYKHIHICNLLCDFWCVDFWRVIFRP